MSIIITNLGDNPNLDGIHSYVVRINDRVITNFSHRREEGLAVCLRKAAEAVDLCYHDAKLKAQQKDNYKSFLSEVNTKVQL